MVIGTIRPPVYSYDTLPLVGVPYIIRGEGDIIEEGTQIVNTTDESPTIRGDLFVEPYDYKAYGNSCILGLAGLGYPVDGFNAIDLQISDVHGEKDDLVLFTYGTGIEKSHVACVSQNLASAHELWECNYTRGFCGNRVISKKDSTIRGYIRNTNFKGLCNISRID